LAESRQFEAHGRLTAFMMHDLKNAAAQLQLMVKNSERHRNNPEFFADAITTVDNAVERINKLIQQLSGRGSAGPTRAAELGALLHDAVARCGQRQPVPAISDGAVAGLMVNCDPTRLTAIFEHVLRNAQEATPVSGEINVTLTEESGQGRIEVRDSGAGMSADFMRARLFRPFDSTKGAQGMGIGAFQVREYVRELGGDVEVFSSAGQGTRFCIMLPVLQNAARG
jgi:putative PEP-CTERM system histidine kinase